MSKENCMDTSFNTKTEQLKLNSESESSSPQAQPKLKSSKPAISKKTVNTKLQPSLSQSINKASTGVNKTDANDEMKLNDLIAMKRTSLFSSVLDFSFNKKRVRILTKTEEVSDKCGGILYWMSREQRVQDNWGLLFAQRLAMKQKISLHVCFCLVPKFLDATIRHYHFMLEGLKEVEKVRGTILSIHSCYSGFLIVYFF